MQVQLADLLGVRERIAVLDQRHGELVREVRMAAAVAGALGEAQVRLLVGVVDALGREALDRLPAGGLAKSGHFTCSGISGSGFFAVCMTSGSCSISGHSTDFLRAVDVDALAILPRGVEEASG